MGLFGQKKTAESRALSVPGTIKVTCNSIPVNNKAIYWFKVVNNGEKIGKLERNGVSASFATNVSVNKLELNMFVQENSGRVTPFGGRDKIIEIGEGQAVDVVFENRKFAVSAPYISAPSLPDANGSPNSTTI